MDFQNDGEYVGGCIAGGRNYFHINSAGDAEPCVFIHFSNTNIHENSILEILQSPLFMAYHNGQPFNNNHLRPCPMLENPEFLQKMVHETGAHQTNMDLLKPLNISAVNARITLKNGRVMPIRSGLKKPTKHHSTQITKK